MRKDDAGIPHLEVKLTHWRPGAGRQREDQFSDGTIRMIGLFWSLLESDSLLLLEEPELSLNDRIVGQLPSIIWKLQSRRGSQVLLSTHSHALLTDPGIGSDEVILLRPDKEGTAALNASSIEEVNTLLQSGMSAADAILPHRVPVGVDELSL
jgi:predicted ATPase